MKRGNKKSFQVLDVCCGSRMFWFNKTDNRGVFIDKRVENHLLNDSSTSKGYRELSISPDVQVDFTKLPFASNYFNLVVFDPPHLKKIGEKAWLALKYGRLEDDWRFILRCGFDECFRVLTSGGVLIFKWNEYEIKVSELLRLTTKSPLFWHKSGKQSKTHWIAFIK